MCDERRQAGENDSAESVWDMCDCPRVATFRRLLAFGLVIVAAGGFVYLRAADKWRSCSTDDSTGSGFIYHDERCDDVSITILAGPLLLILALIWADIAEVELFGLGSVKKRLLEQEGRQNELAAAQQRFENRLEASMQVSTNQTLVANFPTNAADAQAVEGIVDARLASQSRDEDEPAATAETAATARAQLLERAKDLEPWMDVASRMSQPRFVAAVKAAAPSGSLSDAPGLLNEDLARLSLIERPGHPFDVDGFTAWRDENALQLETVSGTVRAGDRATPESVRIALKFADQLWSDLQRRGLITPTA